MNNKKLNFGTRLLLAVMVLVFSLTEVGLKAQNPTTFWYQYGVPVTVYYQPDVYAFQCFGGVAYAGVCDTAVVASMRYRSDRDNIIEIRFKAGTTIEEKREEITNIRLSASFDCDFPVITHDAGLDYSKEVWIITDDLVLVNFKEQNIGMGTLNSFMARNKLEPYSFPVGLPPGNHTYIFRIKHERVNKMHTLGHCPGGAPCQTLPYSMAAIPAHLAHGDFVGACDYDDDPYVVNAIKKAREIILNESAIVMEANPNFANIRTGVDAPPSAGVTITTTGTAACTPNSVLWNIYNDGTFTNPDGGPGVANIGADAKVCDCWNAGLTGAGVRMATVATGVYYLNHPDMTNYLQGWDCTSGSCVPLLSGNEPVQSNVNAGMAISSIGASNTIGVAPNAKLFPVKVVNSTASYVLGFQQLKIPVVSQQLGVIGTDYFNYIVSSSVDEEIRWHYEKGRENSPFPPKGTVVIAPVSGFFNQGGYQTPNYPALNDSVLGVIHSTPDDSLDELNDGWGAGTIPPYPDYAANYGNFYDVASPGNWILCASAEFGNVYNQFMDGSMGSVGTAMGVAALLLEADGNATCMQIINAINSGADQVTYSYPGGNPSTAFSNGRISCAGALAIISVGVEELVDLSAYISVTNPVDESIEIYYDFKGKTFDISYALFDPLGRVLQSGKLENDMGTQSLNVSDLASGMYMLSFTDTAGSVMNSWKILKL